jgi:hypothetical protein
VLPISGQHISSHRFGRTITPADSYSFNDSRCRIELVHPLLYRVNMSSYISKSILFLTFIVVICGGLYAQSLDEHFEPNVSAASYDQSASTSSAAAASNDSLHQQNRDFSVQETPFVEHPTQRLCYFYDC